jgi:murein DD-endopeptidase MepM/ murein hydrolase activator NlpD
MTPAHRDLSEPDLWVRSLARSRKRRALLPRARREQNRRKGVSAVAAAATMAGTGTPLAFAQAPSSGDVQAEIAVQTASQRAIEVRDGGLPLRYGSQGPLVAHVQKALGVDDDGIFGPVTDGAVREYQSRMGLDVDGIVGLETWRALFESASASGLGGSNVPPTVKQRLESKLADAGTQLDAQAGLQRPSSGLFGSDEEAPAEQPAVQAEEQPVGDGVTTEAPAGGQAEQAPAPTPPTTPVSGTCGSTIANPISGTVTSEFGPRWGRNHDGMDIAAPTGTAIRAAACGTVTVAGTQSGYGNIVCITHTSSFSTCYAHMSRFATSQGAQVTQGQVIGYVGCTGSCTGPHVHFETRVNGQAQNPRQYLGQATPAKAKSTTARAAVGPTTPTLPPGTPEAMYDRQQAEALAQVQSSGSGGAMATSGEAVAPAGTEAVAGTVPVAGTAPVAPVAPAGTTPVAPAEGVAPVAPAAPVAPEGTVPVAPVEAAPVAPAPVEAAPVAPAPVEAVPVAPAPVEAAPVAPAPVEVAPAPAPAPVEPAPVAPAPAPVEAAPVAPAPVEAAPAPAETAPAPTEAVPADPAAPATADASAATSVSGGVPAE